MILPRLPEVEPKTIGEGVRACTMLNPSAVNVALLAVAVGCLVADVTYAQSKIFSLLLPCNIPALHFPSPFFPKCRRDLRGYASSMSFVVFVPFYPLFALPPIMFLILAQPTVQA